MVIFVQLIYNAILARILVPEDFGVLAIINVFISFFAILADMGLGNAIVQNKTLQERDIENIYSFSFYVSILLSFSFSVFSIFISVFYKNRVYIPLGVVLSVSVFFNTLNMVPKSLLLRNKKFFSIGLRQIIVNILCSVITVIFALYGFKYYALALNSVLTAIFTFLWNIKGSKLHFKLRFEKSSIKKVSRFSSYLFAFNFMNYFSRNLDNLLIGKFMGNTMLAYYSKAYQVTLYPLNSFTFIITPTLLPIFSDYQDNKKYVYSRYLRVVKILSLIGVFITAYCYGAADEIIFILCGENWKMSADLFKILSMSVWAQMISSTSGSMFQILGMTDLQFKRGILTTFITISAIIIGLLTNNLIWISVLVMIAYNLHFFSMLYFLIRKAFGESMFEFFKKLFPDLAIGACLMLSLYLINKLNIQNILVSAFFKLFVCAVIYLIGLLVTKQYNVFIELLGNKFYKKKKV